MSIRTINRIWEQSVLGGSDLLAMLALADGADDNGVTWISIARHIAPKCRMSNRQTRRLLANAEEAGEIWKHRRWKGGPNCYIVLPGLKSDQLRAAIKKVKDLIRIPGTEVILSSVQIECLLRTSTTSPEDLDDLTPRTPTTSPEDTATAPDPLVPATDPQSNPSVSAGKPAQSDPDADWLKETRIKGESALDDMSPEERAKVADPRAESAPPVEEETALGALRGYADQRDLGIFTTDDMVQAITRFADLSGLVLTTPGIARWHSGMQQAMSNFTEIMEARHSNGTGPGTPLLRRLFIFCIDLWFFEPAGYGHIKSYSPHSIKSSFNALINDAANIAQQFKIKGVPTRQQAELYFAQAAKAGNGVTRRQQIEASVAQALQNHKQEET